MINSLATCFFPVGNSIPSVTIPNSDGMIDCACLFSSVSECQLGVQHPHLVSTDGGYHNFHTVRLQRGRHHAGGRVVDLNDGDVGGEVDEEWAREDN